MSVTLWRISSYGDLSGTGGLRYSARWHSAGRPIIYAANHPAGAMVEMLVHLDRDVMPDRFQLIEIEIESAAAILDLPVTSLPKDWLSNLSATRAIGDAWLASASSLALRVPSVIVPDAWNVLLNPAHSDAHKMRVVSARKVPLDQRLK